MKGMGLAEFDQSEQGTATEPSRFGGGCWRPLCPFRHSGASRAARWAAVWALLAAHERIDEQIVDMPVPQIAVKIPEVVETIRQEHTSDDLPVPQVVKENLEVIKVPQEREDVPHLPEETVKLVKLVSLERGQQRSAEVPMPHSEEETVEAVTLVPREQAQQRTLLSDQEEQLLHSLRNMGRERAMRSLKKLCENHDSPAWLWEGFAELIQRVLFE